VQKLFALLALLGFIMYLIFVAKFPPVATAWGETFTGLGHLIRAHIQGLSEIL
jgi:hypothetical protein